MLIREINSFIMGTAPNVPAEIQTPLLIDDRLRCVRMRDRCLITVTNNTGSTHNLLAEDCADAVACIFGTVRNSFGNKVKDLFDRDMSFAQMRRQYVRQTGKDWLLNGVEYQTHNATDIIASGILTGATASFTVEIPRSFQAIRLGKNMNNNCPGTEQMRQLRHRYTRGAVFNPTNSIWIQTQAVSIVLILDFFEDNIETWARVWQTFVQDEGGRLSHGPEGGAVLAVAEVTNPGLSTVLGLVNLHVKNGSKEGKDILSSCQAIEVVTDGDYNLPFGSFNPNLLDTELLQLPLNVDMDDVPTGELIFEDPGQEQNPNVLEFTYLPSVTPTYVDEYVGPNMIGSENQPRSCRVVNSTPSKNPNLSDHAASWQPLHCLRPSDPQFDTLPSRSFVVGQAPVTFIPAAVENAVQNTVKQHNTSDAQAAAATTSIQAIAKAIPGLASPNRNPAAKPNLAPLGKTLLGKVGEVTPHLFRPS